MMKQRMYEERIRDVEMASFTPLVFATSGGMGKQATNTYKRLAAIQSEQRTEEYSHIMSWIRCRINYSLLRSAIMCIRGSRSHKGRAISDSTPAFDLAVYESRVELQN